MGAKTSRIHHLLSGLEFLTFQIFDWSSRVVDIREHFPLNLSETTQLAENLGLNHPAVNKDLKVVTTNFLIDIKGGEKLAINVLYKKDLSKKRNLEKLQLEKKYWESKGIKWLIVTEEQFTAELKENMAWIRPYVYLSYDEERQIVNEAQKVLFPRLQKGSSKSLMKYCGELDDSYQLLPGSHLEMLRKAVANKQLTVPLNKSFHSWKCNEIELYYPLQVKVNCNVS
jgi:DNA-binding transcriptional ArsR family regulator